MFHLKINCSILYHVMIYILESRFFAFLICYEYNIILTNPSTIVIFVFSSVKRCLQVASII